MVEQLHILFMVDFLHSCKSYTTIDIRLCIVSELCDCYLFNPFLLVSLSFSLSYTKHRRLSAHGREIDESMTEACARFIDVNSLWMLHQWMNGRDECTRSGRSVKNPQICNYNSQVCTFNNGHINCWTSAVPSCAITNLQTLVQLDAVSRSPPSVHPCKMLQFHRQQHSRSCSICRYTEATMWSCRLSDLALLYNLY